MAVHYFSRFHFVCQFVTIVRDSAILFFGVMPWFWKVRICFMFMNLMFITVFISLLFNDYTWLQKSEDFVTLIGLNADNEILHSIAFLAGCMILLQVCVTLTSLMRLLREKERHVVLLVHTMFFKSLYIDSKVINANMTGIIIGHSTFKHAFTSGGNPRLTNRFCKVELGPT